MRAIPLGVPGAARRAALASIALFVLALATGEAEAVAILFLLPVGLAARSHDARLTLATGAAALVLILVAVALAPSAGALGHGALSVVPFLVAVAFVTWCFLEHARTATVLRAREANLQSITDAIPGAVFQFASDADGSSAFTFMSKGVSQLVETSSAQAPTSFETFLAYIVPEDLPELERSIDAAVTGQAAWSHEFRVRTAAGRLKWLSAKSAPEPLRADGGILFNGLIFDVTERVAAQAALEQARHAHDRILEAAGEGIYGIDLEGRITFANPAAARLLGWAAAELIGEPHTRLYETVSDGDGEVRFLSASAFAERGGRHVADAIFRRRDGSSFAIDYVSTPIVERGSLTGAVVVFRDVSETRRLSEALRHQASHDELTGLSNRRDFEQRLTEVLAAPAPAHVEHVLAYVDLDQFKVINDTCGHIAGDELLQQLARLIESQVRRSDTLARLGGDEFGILMQFCTMAQALSVMERLRVAISEFRFQWDDHSFKLGASIGLVPLGAATTDLSEVFRRADAACYAAKDAGRNRIHCYHEGDAELARRHGEMQWVSRINRALEQNEFQLYAQPIVRTSAGISDDAHYEILVRLRETDGTIVAPGAFLPAAERYNLSPLLDRWVMKTAFTWLANHPACLAELGLCCINLSGLTLGEAGSRDYIMRLFAETGVPPAKICFEVTETAAIANLGCATAFINDLKTLGCRFALDDFGSGLSSFAYLKTLPVDYLKIDGIFVRDILDDPMDLAIVKSINEVGHAMGMRTIGEFVENDAILNTLRDIGVDYAQGYGLGRPRPLAEMLGMSKSCAVPAPTILAPGTRLEVAERHVA